MKTGGFSSQTKASRFDRRSAKRVLDTWATRLDAHTVVPNPHIPGVFNQPAYLIVPTPGRLVAIYVSWLPKSRSHWSSVLASVEDLFEIKTVAGSSTVVGLVFLSDLAQPHDRGNDMELLLRRTFEFYHVYHISEFIERKTGILRELSTAVYECSARERYLKLWDHERMLMAEYLQHYDMRVVKPLFEESPYVDTPLRMVRDEIANKLQGELGGDFRLRRNARVFNVKHWLLDSADRYYFTFNLEVPLEIPTLVQITKGRASRTYRRELRSLAAKARLIRYDVDAEGELRPRSADYRLWLAVTGHLCGPDHDKARYVRALMGAGWNITRADLLTTDRLSRGG